MSSAPEPEPDPVGASAIADTINSWVAFVVAVSPFESVVVTSTDSVTLLSSSLAGVKLNVSSVAAMSASGPVIVNPPAIGVTTAPPTDVNVVFEPEGNPVNETDVTASDPSVSTSAYVMSVPNTVGLSSSIVVEADETVGASATGVIVTGCVCVFVAVEPSASVAVTVISRSKSSALCSSGVSVNVSIVARMSASGPVMIKPPTVGVITAEPTGVTDGLAPVGMPPISSAVISSEPSVSVTEAPI